MFKNIIVPISSEFYSNKVIKRSLFLAETFQSTIHILYVIEENSLKQMNKFSDTHLTHYNRTETHQALLQNQRQTADTIIQDELQPMFKQKNITMKYSFVHGEYSTSIKNELTKNQYDLVLMGYEKQCLIDYRVIDEITIPIWIEGGGHHESMLAICSNLAPNQKVPALSIILSEAFNWELFMLYIIDSQDTVKVDENGKRSIRKPKQDLLIEGQQFVNKMQEEDIKVEMVQGSIEQQTIKAANKIEAGLIIIGREQKQKGILGLPVKKIKQKITEKCKYSILFLN
jgi:K+-sensing histidine kinase KdpD